MRDRVQVSVRDRVQVMAPHRVTVSPESRVQVRVSIRRSLRDRMGKVWLECWPALRLWFGRRMLAVWLEIAR